MADDSAKALVAALERPVSHGWPAGARQFLPTRFVSSESERERSPLCQTVTSAIHQDFFPVQGIMRARGLAQWLPRARHSVGRMPYMCACVHAPVASGEW